MSKVLEILSICLGHLLTQLQVLNFVVFRRLQRI